MEFIKNNSLEIKLMGSTLIPLVVSGLHGYLDAKGIPYSNVEGLLKYFPIAFTMACTGTYMGLSTYKDSIELSNLEMISKPNKNLLIGLATFLGVGLGAWIGSELNNIGYDFMYTSIR